MLRACKIEETDIIAFILNLEAAGRVPEDVRRYPDLHVGAEGPSFLNNMTAVGGVPLCN